MYASNFEVLSASEILTPSTLSHSVTSCFASRRASETRTTSSVVWPVIALYATKPITAVMMLTPTETATMMLRFAMSAADQRLEDARVALERATLHVELKAAAAAELFTAAGAAGAAVDERRQHRARPRRLCRHLRRAEVAPAGPRRRRAAEAGGPVAIVGVRRADEAAFTLRDERGREGGVAGIAADRRHRTERLVLVERRAVHGIGRAADDRADEEALALGHAERRDLAEPAVHALGRLREARDACAHGLQLCGGRDRTHADLLELRVADLQRRESLLDRVAHVGELVGRHEHAEDRGALLAGLLGHVANDVREEQVADLARLADVGEQSSGRPDQHLELARGQERLEQLGDPVRDERGRGRRLRDHRHARDQRARQLLARAPRREVERVDVDRDAAPRRPHVLAAHSRRPADLDRLAVAEQLRAAELRAELGVVRQRDRRAIDVELRIAARVAAVRDRERDQLLARVRDRLREGTDQLATLRERQRRELARAGRPRVREGAG